MLSQYLSAGTSFKLKDNVSQNENAADCGCNSTLNRAIENSDGSSWDISEEAKKKIMEQENEINRLKDLTKNSLTPREKYILWAFGFIIACLILTIIIVSLNKKK